jgi:hypothetical protein
MKCNWDFNLQTLCITRGPILYHIKYFNTQSLKIEEQMWNANLRFQTSNSMHSHSKPLTSACIILLTSFINHQRIAHWNYCYFGKSKRLLDPSTYIESGNRRGNETMKIPKHVIDVKLNVQSHWIVELIW